MRVPSDDLPRLSVRVEVNERAHELLDATLVRVGEVAEVAAGVLEGTGSPLAFEQLQKLELLQAEF